MSARAELLLDVLCVCVRALTRHQAMRLLGFSDEANFRRFVRDLIARGLVAQITVPAKPVPEMREPLYSWRITDPRLTNGIIQHVLSLARARWAGRPAVNTTVIAATSKAGRIYGAQRSGRPRKPLQCTHDIALSAVFVHKSIYQPVEAKNWYGEDFANLRLGNKTVDAVVSPGAGNVICKLIECVGADYTYDKLLTIAREAVSRGLPYEFW